MYFARWERCAIYAVLGLRVPCHEQLLIHSRLCLILSFVNLSCTNNPISVGCCVSIRRSTCVQQKQVACKGRKSECQMLVVDRRKLMQAATSGSSSVGGQYCCTPEREVARNKKARTTMFEQLAPAAPTETEPCGTVKLHCARVNAGGQSAINCVVNKEMQSPKCERDIGPKVTPRNDFRTAANTTQLDHAARTL